MTEDVNSKRRQLLLAGGVGLGGALMTARATSATGAAAGGGPGGAAGSAAPIDAGAVSGTKIDFPPIDAASERPDAPPPALDAPVRRVGYAIMGLGRLALENILPAFGMSKHARPVALISGSPQKMRVVAGQYGISPEACYGYADLAKIRGNRDIQVVYVVLPNSLHRDAVVEAAGAGKHVLCEKPMATTVEEARAMVDACKRANTKLMIAYRCQYETYNRELSRRARAGEFGAIQLIDAINTQNQGDATQWRQRRALAGGGSLPDVGLYCLNTTRALLGEEPIEISARIFSPPNDARFAEVESNVSFTLRFPSGVIANCASSYSAHVHRNLRVLGATGAAEIENAFAYEGQKLKVFRREAKAEITADLTLPHRNQFALEIDHMALCVRDDREPHTPGEEGLQDQILMAAIYEAARSGTTVKLAPNNVKTDAFRGPSPADE